ncbi:MAG TPA: hypothetical protein VN604_10655, partial [Nitrospirota bacterium]|nr:hypothetical protein [Nitrospirota bacterium]
MQQDSPLDIQKRLPFLVMFIVLFAAVLIFRLWYLQIVRGDFFYEQAESNRIRPVKIRPPRGVMYDRRGRPLVENELTFDISLVPEDAQDLDDAIARLAPIVRMKPNAVRALLNEAAPIRTKYEPVKIKEEVSWEEVAVVEAHQDDLPGVIVEP